ncbi:MAG: hypothetical protein U0V70_01470 [Terriglobia bacterium]
MFALIPPEKGYNRYGPFPLQQRTILMHEGMRPLLWFTQKRHWIIMAAFSLGSGDTGKYRS